MSLKTNEERPRSTPVGRHYHKRRNVESTSSAIKRKFGPMVMSRSDAGMVNEVLGKLLCHNLACVIMEQECLGISTVFWNDEPS